jgi:anti-sigma-K factor RskA
MSVDIHTLSGAYALNAVTDLERVAFDRHLAECDTCAQEASELVATVARLTDSTWSVAPPSLREKVLREVSQTRQVPPGSGRRGMAAPRRWRTRLVSAAAAAVLVVAAAGATYALQEDRVRGQRAQAEAGQQQLAAIASVFTAGDLRVRRAQAGSGTLSVAVSPQRNAAVATMDGMPRPQAGRCYQFWRMQDGNPVSAGVLSDGRTDRPKLISDVGEAQAIAVTEEPCAGSTQPTMAPIAAVTIA